MQASGSGGAKRADDRRVLIRFGNELRVTQMGRQFRDRRGGDERERDVFLVEAGRHLEALPVGQVYIEQGEVHSAAEMTAGCGEVAANFHHLVADALDKKLEIEGNQGVVFENENTHDPLRRPAYFQWKFANFRLVQQDFQAALPGRRRILPVTIIGGNG